MNNSKYLKLLIKSLLLFVLLFSVNTIYFSQNNELLPEDSIINEWFDKSSQVARNVNIDGSDSPENRKLNRRVEIKTEKPKMVSHYIQL